MCCAPLPHAILMRTLDRRWLSVPIRFILGCDAWLNVIHLTMRLLAGAQIRTPSAVANRKIHDHIGARLVAQHLLRAKVAAVVIKLVDFLNKKP